MLLGDIGRFIPGRISGNHGRLRHVGWEKCGQGLTCRPRETSGEGFLDDVLQLFGYSVKSGAALLAGSLKLRYFSGSLSLGRSQHGVWCSLVGLLTCSLLVVRVWVWLQLSHSGGCLTILGFGELEVLGRESDSPFLRTTCFFGAANPL